MTGKLSTLIKVISFSLTLLFPQGWEFSHNLPDRVSFSALASLDSHPPNASHFHAAGGNSTLENALLIQNEPVKM